MDKVLRDMIESYGPLMASVGFHKIFDTQESAIQFERSGWRLDFLADRYYSGVVINLVEVGVKEYSLSIMKEAVCNFERCAVSETREQVTEYGVTIGNQIGHEGRFENVVIDLINFFVKKFEFIRANKKELNKIYDRIATTRLREIGLRFVDD